MYEPLVTLLIFDTFNCCAVDFNVCVNKPEVMEFARDAVNLLYVAMEEPELKNTL